MKANERIRLGRRPSLRVAPPPKGLREQVAALAQELKEARERRTATADVLKVIGGSPGELEPAFKAMLANATRLCNAQFGTLNLYDGDVFRIVAVHNVPPAFAECSPARVDRAPSKLVVMPRYSRREGVVPIEDIRKGRAYLDGDPAVVAVSELGGARTIVLVPLLKDDALVGTIAIYRQEVLSFTDKQIELVKNFAAQAVIAIENARLLSELRESLQQQTATADVLRVISSSPGELKPVFNAILANAVRICDANLVTSGCARARLFASAERTARLTPLLPIFAKFRYSVQNPRQA